MKATIGFKLLLFLMWMNYLHCHSQISSLIRMEEFKKQAEKQIFKTNSGALPYRLIPPPKEVGKQQYPMLVYLHGMGTRGKDNETPLEKFAPFLIDSMTGQNKFPCYVLIPQCPDNDVWVSFPGFPQSLASPAKATTAGTMVVQLIRQLLKTKNIDSSRIYLSGYSMGGEGTFDLISREPGLFACGVPLASVADTARAGMFAHTPVWAFHGADDQVNDVKYTRLMVDAIRNKGGEIRYSEIPACGHDCRAFAYRNNEVWEWMFRQQKKIPINADNNR